MEGSNGRLYRRNRRYQGSSGGDGWKSLKGEIIDHVITLVCSFVSNEKFILILQPNVPSYFARQLGDHSLHSQDANMHENPKNVTYYLSAKTSNAYIIVQLL
uniref:Uncharacterized protein n=1 Tax=Lygus hesperus TaxID=30085 RepID=A0A146KMF9_LYGHE